MWRKQRDRRHRTQILGISVDYMLLLRYHEQ